MSQQVLKDLADADMAPINVREAWRCFEILYKDSGFVNDPLEAYCAEAENLGEAIKRAVRAQIDGKYQPPYHQVKVRLEQRLQFGREIWLTRNDWLAMHNFDDRYDFFDEIKPWGVGPITIYDTLVRITCFLKDHRPTSIYMHGGVPWGMKAIELSLGRKPHYYRMHRVPQAVLKDDPYLRILGEIDADDAEDFICGFHQVFQGWLE